MVFSCNLNFVFKEIAQVMHMNNVSPRYDIKMYPTFIHLHGKTFDYKIPASTVMRLFLLPHKVESSDFYYCLT